MKEINKRIYGYLRPENVLRRRIDMVLHKPRPKRVDRDKIPPDQEISVWQDIGGEG